MRQAARLLGRGHPADTDGETVGERASVRVEDTPQTRTRTHTSADSAPPTDRGHEITSGPRQPFQVHWFTGVAYLSAEDVLAHVYDVAGASFVALPFGRTGYRTAYQAVELPGLMVLCDPGEPDTMPPTCLVVPGESCEALGWQRLQALSAPFKPTRVDLAFDDFPYTPAEVKALILNGSVRTRAQRHTVKFHEDYANTRDDDLEPSQTVSLGSRGSSAFFRCYNSRGFDRGELELKGARAEAACELLQLPLDQAREMALSFMRLFLDFVDPASDVNKTRQDLLPVWAAWIERFQKAVVELPPRPVQTLEKSRLWFKNQVASTAAMLREAYGPASFEALLMHGEQRWTSRHLLLAGGRGYFPAGVG